MDAVHLGEAMQELTDDECEAIRLIIQDGKSYHHAAKALGVTVTTINNWKHRGLAKLRKYADRTNAFDRSPSLGASATG
jgi:RNA polymerase sigma factor (sigma-70 family)